MPLLSIRNLSVTFDTASGPFKAVDGIDLVIDSGEVLGIVGESGSGKSVAMLGLMGLLPPSATVTADEIAFEGRDMQAMSARERRKIIGRDIAMIFQEPVASLNPCFNVGYQIKEALKAHTDLDRKARQARAVELLQLVGIPEPERRLTAFPHQLSGGMSQRVMIAMATACNPKLLIADEPTTALDVTIQAQILDLLLDLQKQHGMAMILITHDMGVIAETAERVVVQYAGQQVERQPVATLFDEPHHPYTAALLSAIPERATGTRLPTIPGVVPGQGDRPDGCLFNPRCPKADDVCRTVVPPRQPPALGEALCHYPLGADPRAPGDVPAGFGPDGGFQEGTGRPADIATDLRGDAR
ncbi:ATP-binding protein, ABC-type peptide transporter [Aurantimonas manganoxydans SI85-9A1]|uniref:ATP-binding protein, ABC-type peptide transporter n=1 Tax=Aurantimonas manganoxydans (strain ATCC BAA-1229 / DSM 21871 / SI85-9A1) TaxID=287752 RepID=Q1YLS6_AURMS|nr:ABC transporter ATP-binding protein [Aurantimonas manganoxydans]EAS51655.1 ATP-binding protein, ABC-type peptide transporter [Aurantimonas manganoxydans SI85-9A1]